MISKKTLLQCLFFLLLGLLACSEDKKTKATATQKPTITTPIPEPAFTGAVYINDTSTPASGYLLYLLNHSQRTFVSFVTDSTGVFVLPMKNLRRFESYSLHIVDDNYKYIAPVTFDSVDNFEFLGGESLNLGNLIINRDTFGAVDIGGSSIDLTPIAGVQAGTASGSLSDFAFSADYASIKVGAHLFVYKPETLLESFYLAGTNTLEYERSIMEWSGFRISAELTDPVNNTMKAGILIDGSTIIGGGRVLVDESLSPLRQPLWDKLGRNLRLSSSGIDTVVFPQTIARENEFMTFDLVYYKGLDVNDTTTYNYLGQLGMTFAMPPLISGMSQGTSTTVAIDYSSSTDENGLTRPFCRNTGDVYLSLTPPTAFGSAPITYNDLNQVIVKFIYYYELNGVKTKAELETNPSNDPLLTSDYPIGFSSGFTNSSLSYATRVWDPHTQTIAFNFTATGNMAAHNLQLFSTPFISGIPSLNNVPITEIELRLIYEGPKHRTGIITRFEFCP